jgi:Protein of unknown function (DUF2442)
METVVDILTILCATYTGGYRIELTFSDGVVRIVDFERFLRAAKNPMARKYLDLTAFQLFALDNGDLQWNDFELCFQLENLYEGKM